MVNIIMCKTELLIKILIMGMEICKNRGYQKRSLPKLRITSVGPFKGRKKLLQCFRSLGWGHTAKNFAWGRRCATSLPGRQWHGMHHHNPKISRQASNQ